MDGLRRLMAQGDFTKPACVLKAMREYEIENNPVLGFLTEYKNPMGLATSEVYTDFQGWCLDNGHKGISSKTKFSREVCRQYHLETKPRRDPRNKNKFERYFVTPETVTNRDTL